MACNFVFCELCACELGGRPCPKCVQLEYACEGTCACCEENRKKAQMEECMYATGGCKEDYEFCIFCACSWRETSCIKCEKLGFRCEGTCLCCIDHRSRPPIATSSPHKFVERACINCECITGEYPCVECTESNFNCPGTCNCCMTQRSWKIFLETLPQNTSFGEMPEDSPTCSKSSSAFRQDDGFCKHCPCELGNCPCGFCVEIEFNCPGTCSCCEINRKWNTFDKTSSKDASSEGRPVDSQTDNIYSSDFKPEGSCKECACEPGIGPCLICINMFFNCPGTCSCCKTGPKGKTAKKLSFDES